MNRRWPRGVWLRSFVAALAVVACASVTALVIALGGEPRRDASRRPAPPPSGAFAHGGVPRAHPAVERALTHALPRYFALLDDWRRARRRRTVAPASLATARRDVLSDEVAAALGPHGARALATLLDQARLVAEIRATDLESIDEAWARRRRFADAVGAFDDALAAADLGYFVDAQIVVDSAGGGWSMRARAFAVERVDRFRSDAGDVRALHLRALDDRRAGILGFTKPTHRDALVMFDEIELIVERSIRPALAPEGRLRLADRGAAGSWVARVEQRAGSVVRSEIATLEDAAPSLARSIARHEVQHRLDFALPRPPRMPDELARHVGPAERLGEPRPFAAQARDELSAYLAELARDELTTRTNLTLLGRFLFDQESWRSAEYYAALVAFGELADELGLAAPRASGPDVDRERLAALYLALTDLPTTTVRRAARRAWERLFDRRLPTLERLSQS